MTANMGTIWDRATGFLNDKRRAWWPVALIAIFVPHLIGDVAQLGAESLGQPVAQGIALIVALVALWGQLVIVALALDPAPSAAGARRSATRGYGRALIVMLILFVVAMVLLAPLLGVLAASGVDFMQMTSGNATAMEPDISSGTATFSILYVLVIFVVALFVGARLFPLYPVIVAEARGARAITRAFAVTRGLTWKLVGVLILFGIVLAVAAAAARSVTGVIVALIFPASGDFSPGAIAGAVAGALVTTAFTVIVSAFSAKLYSAVASAPVGAVEIA